ncbi:type III pantothenate kinase [Cellulosilyticum sp. ST5]|uniref:Type III pantothenate kinase n=1 Tax=Cellulosilyticum lentocellum (strain ATCC 49066 / DSM 5427 / NCIMB 11756 / RHM5) TaxID=642492 RepID=F2JR86_CELLD|nr:MULTISPECIES: type III pantothenate kinase [Cellulosilyticum]ADZ85067.1 putative transcriptional acitvator, Baf family [Cellulosilyticum lentocellum DSM 5427]QEH70617.1 type III pantothenate kinase [Cellulosilyticum sp. WCF-2]
MLLAIDIGNTNIVMGVMKGLELISSFRLTTQTPRTSDEYGIMMVEMLRQKEIKIQDITAVIISSVVPDIMYSFNNGIKRYLRQKPLIVGPGLKTGLAVRTDNPREVGADRIVNCVATYELYGGPCMAIDFGTSTTYDIVNAKGEFIGGLITPGIRICADALWQRAAQLPHMEIKKTKGILDCKNTTTSMQSGLVYGYIGQIEYIVKKVKEEMQCDDLKVIATGGLAKIIQDGTSVIEKYDGILTLKGLALIYEKNR